MEEAPFWDNVGKFARFFISTVTGLILGLLSPFAQLFSKSPTFAAIGAALTLGVLAFFYATLSAMQTTPVETAQQTAGVVEPAVSDMLRDLYGQ